MCIYWARGNKENSFTKKLSEGGPMKGLELIMWPQGKWKAKKLYPMAQTDIPTDMATLWLNRPSGVNSVKKPSNPTNTIVQKKGKIDTINI